MISPRIRSDISKFLVHLTRDSQDVSAEDNLISILSNKKIEARNYHCLFSPKLRNMQLTQRLLNSFKTVCLTETPLDQIHKLAAEDEKRQIKLKPFGVVFWRDIMLDKGANPAIYLNGDGTALKTYLIGEFNKHFNGIKSVNALKEAHPNYKEIIHYYSLINLMASRHDFSWEREWRINGDFNFKYSDVVAIVAEDPSAFMEKCKKTLPEKNFNYINRIPIISPSWSYEDVIEEMAIKIWQKNV